MVHALEWLVSLPHPLRLRLPRPPHPLTYPDNDESATHITTAACSSAILRRPAGSIISTDLSYLPSGQMAQIDYGNGVRTTYAYDSACA